VTVAFGRPGGCGIVPSGGRNLIQYRFDGRTIRRTGADMMQGNDPVRIDENIPSPLENVPFRLPQPFPLHQEPQVSPPRFRPPYIPEGCGEHPVLPVGFTGVIDQKRPGQGSFGHVTAGKEIALERDHCDFHVPSVKFIFMITQLRDVRPAGESAEVAVENQ
jgi:hypothetical protein